jgi:hypothetical protein
MNIFYRFKIYKNNDTKKKINGPSSGIFSIITFVHCADFSKNKMPEFSILGDYLVDVATKKDQNLMETPSFANSRLI